jgi:hypothetical protein
MLDSNAFAIGPKRIDMPDPTPAPDLIAVHETLRSTHSANGVSAVHNQVRAVDHRCRVARQEHSGICDFPRLRETTDRDLCASKLALLAAQKRAVISVFTTVGEMALTVTPRSPHSTPWTAAFQQTAFEAA